MYIFNKLILTTFAATVAQPNAVLRETLMDFGQYVGECMPKFVQKVQVRSNENCLKFIYPCCSIPFNNI